VQTNAANNYDVFVEVVGTVNPDLSIREQSFTNFGTNFGLFHSYSSSSKVRVQLTFLSSFSLVDLANYDQVIKLQQNPVVSELFA